MTTYYQLGSNFVWTGNTVELPATDPCPAGSWVISGTPPELGQKWTGSGWSGVPASPSTQITADDRYQAAMAQQLKSCDSNKVSLLTSIKLLSQITGTPPKPKAAAALTWWAGLWSDRNARDAENAQNADFSGHGDCPYSYQELLDESQS